MATEKVTITLKNNEREEIRSLVASGAAASISGFIQHAVGVALHDVAEWRELLNEALAETGGSLNGSERAWADKILSAQA
jgi:Arc/MetJ-type ribon-helix-helix transcriptional regulator